MSQVIGICSLCGGQVTLPGVWHGLYPPAARCESCRATAALPQLPVVPMRPDKGDKREYGETAATMKGTATYRLGDY